MAFDFKKEYKAFYLPPASPEIVTVPPMRYIALRGRGDPNEEDGAYRRAVGVLYALAYTLKMSRKSGYEMEGFFDYVVPPLEGFWTQEGREDLAFDYGNKAALCWISAIRLPDFVQEGDFRWAVETASRKKGLDCSAAEFLALEEGLCVQILHRGPYDTEPESVARMDALLQAEGCVNDPGGGRLHHEIYLSDPRRCAPEKLRTVIRHPIRRELGVRR